MYSEHALKASIIGKKNRAAPGAALSALRRVVQNQNPEVVLLYSVVPV